MSIEARMANEANLEGIKQVFSIMLSTAKILCSRILCDWNLENKQSILSSTKHLFWLYSFVIALTSLGMFILQALTHLSSAGFGAKLLGVFANGMVQSFIVGRTLDPIGINLKFVFCCSYRILPEYHIKLKSSTEFTSLSLSHFVLSDLFGISSSLLPNTSVIDLLTKLLADHSSHTLCKREQRRPFLRQGLRGSFGPPFKNVKHLVFYEHVFLSTPAPWMNPTHYAWVGIMLMGWIASIEDKDSRPLVTYIPLSQWIGILRLVSFTLIWYAPWALRYWAFCLFFPSYNKQSTRIPLTVHWSSNCWVSVRLL